MLLVNLIYQETKNETILVLSSNQGWKPAMLVNLAGGQEELTCFERDDTTEAYKSCSINWQNQLFIFGGSSEKRQISQLSGYKLKRIGDLLFDLDKGACGVMGNKLFLCFSYDDGRRCRRSNSPFEQFSEVALSAYWHRNIQATCSDSKLLLSSAYW